MRTVKDEARLLGVDDAPFQFEDEETELVGTVFRGGSYIEGVLMGRVAVDGFDATDEILHMVNESRHHDQIQAVLLDGITYAGFNVVDIQAVAEQGEVGVVAVSRNRPVKERMDSGLDNVDRAEDRRSIIERAGEAKEHSVDEGTMYFQHAGIPEGTARELLDLATVRGQVPEPVRVSHMIAGALEDGAEGGA